VLVCDPRRAMRIAEPATTLTDYVLAAASIGCAVALSRSIGVVNRLSVRFWCAAFVRPRTGLARQEGRQSRLPVL